MKPDFDNMSLIVTNGLNGKTIVFDNFYVVSEEAREKIITSLVIPILDEYKSVHLSIGYKN